MPNGMQAAKKDAEKKKKQAEKDLAEAAALRKEAADLRKQAEEEDSKQKAADLLRKAKMLERRAAELEIKAKVEAAIGIFEDATGELFDPGDEFHLQVLMEIIRELEAARNKAQIEKWKKLAEKLRKQADAEKDKKKAAALRKRAGELEDAAERFSVASKVNAATWIFERVTGIPFDPSNEFHVQLLLDIIKELEEKQGFNTAESTVAAVIPAGAAGINIPVSDETAGGTSTFFAAAGPSDEMTPESNKWVEYTPGQAAPVKETTSDKPRVKPASAKKETTLKARAAPRKRTPGKK